MTKENDHGVRKDPRSAVALAVALLAAISIEAMYLENLWKGGEEAHQTNGQLDAANSQMQRHLAELRSSAQKITAIFTRLNDGIIQATGIAGRLPVPGHNPKSSSEYGDSKEAKSLQEFGLVVKSFQEGHHETSVSFEAGSNRLELHRLVPFLAEQENSNAFLFVDKLDLVRPLAVPSFSMNPASLETRLLIRVLSGPK
jgi:hypothetical protein